MKICIYPGTFDPVTNGHLDVVGRAARVFDKVVIGVALNKDKKPLFDAEDRLRMIQENLSPWPNVSATVFEGLLMDFAREQKATALVRGLRAVSDFEFEFQMALMNRHLNPAVETIFLMPHESYSFTSSSLMKQVSKFGGNISKFVPPNVAEALRQRAHREPAIEPTTLREQ
jgi:pantetheine-phosphate adenylyltransferase